jgi:ankyrin repeat protein
MCLKKGADINYIDKEGYTSLTLALASDKHAMMQFLISNGAKINICSIGGMSLIHYVVFHMRCGAINKNQEKYKSFLEKFKILVKGGADLNLKSGHDLTVYDIINKWEDADTRYEVQSVISGNI